MPPVLVAISEGSNIPLDKPILLLGRHQECDIQLASRKVSRKHCCIAQVHDYLVVRDLGSTNGVRINGVRVTEGKLKSGDELTIGSHQYRVDWDGTAARPARVNGNQTHQASPEELESCDEPFPIAEPVKPPVVALPYPPHIGGEVLPPALTPTERSSQAGAAAPQAASPILPEEIQLAPSSHDSAPPQLPSRPDSHPSRETGP